jgi:hypothetical protein
MGEFCALWCLMCLRWVVVSRNSGGNATLALTSFQNDLNMLYRRGQTDIWRRLNWMDMLWFVSWFVLWLSRYYRPRSRIPVSDFTEG